MRKLKNLITPILTLLLLAVMLAACGGSSTPEVQEPERTESATSQEAENRDAGSQETTQAEEPLPTSPSRLANLGTLTPAPQPTSRTRPTSIPLVTPQAGNGEQTQNSGENQEPTETTVLKAEDLIPQDPRTNDDVLLQDIYARMDLDQFALDPTQPIERFEEGNEGHTVFSTRQLAGHPYLFMFPSLEIFEPRKKWLDGKTQFRFTPYKKSPLNGHGNPNLGRGNYDTFKAPDVPAKDSLIYFIYHPWFEEFHVSGPQMWTALGSTKLTSYWFGNNSTRGVLAKAVAEMMEDAVLPEAQSQPISWKNGSERYEKDNPQEPKWIERDWNLDEYVRITVNRYYGGNPRASAIHARDVPNRNVPEFMRQHYRSPKIRWEFLHDQLPIIRVTAENSKIFPLAIPGTTASTRIGETFAEPTEYSVSFVISFQNRWASLDDPNRWHNRFEGVGDSSGDIIERYRYQAYSDEQMARMEANSRGTRPRSTLRIEDGIRQDGTKDTIRDRWYDKDYMQHRIIGPVVLQVYESGVLKPGIYSTVPRVTHWEAPGHIATDQQILRKNHSRSRNPEGYHFNYTTKVSTPNANWPLPGHVITFDYNGPGTRIWDRHAMSEHDW